MKARAAPKQRIWHNNEWKRLRNALSRLKSFPFHILLERGAFMYGGYLYGVEIQKEEIKLIVGDSEGKRTLPISINPLSFNTLTLTATKNRKG